LPAGAASTGAASPGALDALGALLALGAATVLAAQPEVAPAISSAR